MKALEAVASDTSLSTVDILLWDVLPYVTIAVFVVGMIWRYRYDRFGWTTRSSQLYERKLIRIASPIFHFGILAVVGGHIVGLLIPQAWTDGLGISEDTYHFFAVLLGAFAGAATLFGIVMLIYRRRTVGPVFAATTKNDKVMYIFLLAAILLGIVATLSGAGVLGDGHNYREDVSVWFRSIFYFDPQGQLMASAPLAFKIHALAGMALFIVWPFTRLVHAFSAPFGYVFRPYVVYRDRGPHDAGNREPRRGWEKVGGP
ncbi:MAG: respiratory nitrate reductase subunit gamma [Candidatus Nanopelagicales bacterium]|jgi:nitrate reductase gamma subunit|nr:respiratory nitrate reductase subunit gamma [Candidatus Nanopelagicales bacterium]MCU0298814.1 respiratory nitrate reductase subunit gamma [Candidatus Nanopelagicales bacterium]